MPEFKEREMFRGDTLVFDVQVFQAQLFGLPPDQPTPPQDITGWKMWFTAKGTVVEPDSSAFIRQTSDPSGGIVFTDAVLGRARVTVPSLSTRAFADGPVALQYDVQVKDLSGNIFTIERGTLTVFPDVTRAIT